MSMSPLRVASEDGLVLREWTDADVPRMVALFDEPAVAEWTPLESPFDTDAATRYLERAREARGSGRALQLAITTDGVLPLGEVLLFPGPDGTGELGYAVGAAHRGAGLAARAVTQLREYAEETHGLRRFVLRIAPGNTASARVASACGFRLTAEPPLVREIKGRRTELATWAYPG
jgi:RimJ/RimL family protein N-acetyltransferase